jgi:hypothetical protein
MTINSTLDAIDPHAYGLRAASNCDALIDQLFKSTSNVDLIATLKLIDEVIPHADDRQRAQGALIHFAATGDKESAAQMIKGHEYLIAYLPLGKHMHALKVQSEKPEIIYPVEPIDDKPSYPNRDANYQPIFESIIEVLTETQMAAHAPTAAISAATNSII